MRITKQIIFKDRYYKLIVEIYANMNVKLELFNQNESISSYVKAYRAGKDTNIIEDIKPFVEEYASESEFKNSCETLRDWDGVIE